MGTSNWLLEGIPSLPSFSQTLSQLVVLLLDACAVETDPALLVKYISFLSHHLPDDQLVSMVTLLSSQICKRFHFLKNILTDSSTLLSRFTKAFDMFVEGVATPPTHLDVDQLRILCLTDVNQATKEVVIQWDFLNAIWLLLSLMSDSKGNRLVDILLSQTTPIKIIAMATREPRPVLRDRTLQLILGGSNSLLVESIVGVASLQSLVHYLGSHGIPLANTDIIIREVLERGITPSDTLVAHVKSHLLRGCGNARRLLQVWGVSLEGMGVHLRDLVSLPKPRKRQLSCFLPEKPSAIEIPNLLKVFSDPPVTAKVILYLLTNHGNIQKCVEVVQSVLMVLKSPSDRKRLMNDLETNEYSCLLFSLLKQLAPMCGLNADPVLFGIAEIIKYSSRELLAVLKNLTHRVDDHPHESICQAIRVLKAGVTSEGLQGAPIVCDLVEVLDPELEQLVTDKHNLLNVHVLQKAIHQSSQRTGHQLIQTILQLKIQSVHVDSHFTVVCTVYHT